MEEELEQFKEDDEKSEDKEIKEKMKGNFIINQKQALEEIDKVIEAADSPKFLIMNYDSLNILEAIVSRRPNGSYLEKYNGLTIAACGEMALGDFEVI